jgi:hypothetical protein
MKLEIKSRNKTGEFTKPQKFKSTVLNNLLIMKKSQGKLENTTYQNLWY